MGLGHWFATSDHPIVATVRQYPRASVYIISIALHLALAPFLIHDWDGYVFIQSARDFMQGITPYQRAEMGGANIYVGFALPVVNSWYAYPPMMLLLVTPIFAILTSLSGSPAVARLAIKIPFIIGDLLLAWVARELVILEVQKRDILRAEQTGDWVERALLLNPFLIFISGIWGMFDAWMFVFLLASILFLERDEAMLGGALLSLAVLVKPFPAFVAPFILVWIWWTRSKKDFALMIFGGAAAAAIVCLPFYLEAPQGFIQLIFLNQTTRAPQGLGFFVLLGGLSYVNTALNLGLPQLQSEALNTILSNVSFAILIALLLILYLRALKVRDVEHVVVFSLVALVGFLLVGKVVNEQYFEMPIILGLVAYALTSQAGPVGFWKRVTRASDGREAEPRVRWMALDVFHPELYRSLALAFTGGGFIVAVFEGYHFMTFVPWDVAERITTVNQQLWLPMLRDALGASDAFMALAPEVLSLLALVPALIFSLRLVVPEIAGPFQRIAAKVPSPKIRSRPRAFAAVSVVAILVVSSIAGLAMPSSVKAASYNPAPLSKSGPLVAVVYNIGWNNPAHDTTVLYGNWRNGVTETPTDGYYTMSAGKMAEDFPSMAAHGIDVVLYRYQPADPALYSALGTLAYQNGLLVAPYIDLAYLRQDPRCEVLLQNDTKASPQAGLSLRTECRNLVTSDIQDAIITIRESPSLWKIHGEPVVFVGNTSFIGLDGMGEVKDAMKADAQRLAWGEGNASEPAPATGVALDQNYTTTMPQLEGAGGWAGLYRRAFADLEVRFWQTVRKDSENTVGPLYLVAGASFNASEGIGGGLANAFLAQPIFNATSLVSPAYGWQEAGTLDSQMAAWNTSLAIESEMDRAVGGRFIVSVSPGFAPGPAANQAVPVSYGSGTNGTYDAEWRTAIALRPDAVVVQSWNDFDLGDAIEPTTDYGEQWLAATATYAALYHNTTAQTGHDSALLLTDLLGTSELPRVPDPDWTARLTTELATSSATYWPGGAALLDLNTADWSHVNFSTYPLVAIEPGPAVLYTSHRPALMAALEAYLAHGGKVLLLGGYSDPTFGALAHWNESALSTAPTLTTPTGNVTIPLTDRVVNEAPPANATVLLRFTEGKASLPALWSIPYATGTVFVTAFKPQDVPDARAFAAVMNATGAGAHP
ncbi:MAG: glycosyltransferase 87 family protein [Thermoplasmatota archaeon]